MSMQFDMYSVLWDRCDRRMIINRAGNLIFEGRYDTPMDEVPQIRWREYRQNLTMRWVFIKMNRKGRKYSPDQGGKMP